MAEITDYVIVSNLIEALVDAREGSGIILPGGEINTGENIGTSGLGWYAGKDGSVLQFYKVINGSLKTTVVFNPIDEVIELDILPSEIDHQTLDGAGVADHAELDSHLARTDNPHRTSPDNLQPGTLAGLNAALPGVTLDDKNDPRDPNKHATSHEFGQTDPVKGDIIQSEPIVGSPALPDDILAYETTPSKQWVPKPVSGVVRRRPITLITTTPYSVALTDGPQLLSRYSGGNSVIDLPDPAGETPDSKTNSFYLYNESDGVITSTINSGGNTFADGISQYNLKPGEAVTLELNQTASGAVWSRRTSHLQHLKARRVATWASSNFNSAPPKAIPFDTLDFTDNDKVLNWPGADNTEIVLNRTGRFKADTIASFNTLVDSGPTNFVLELRLNGTLIPGASDTFNLPASLVIDPTIVLPSIPFDASQGDILTVHILATGAWNGELTNAMVAVESEV